MSRILDLSMPNCGGFQAAQYLRESVPGIRILILTMHAAAPILRHLRKAGVSAYLAKNEAPRMLVLAVRANSCRRTILRIACSAVAPDGKTCPVSEYVPVQFLLTARENFDVMRLLALGKSNKELAFDLDMSVRTVETHRASVLKKLNVESIGDIVRIAVRDGII